MINKIDIIFDFDGTLIDSSQGIIDSLYKAFQSCGICLGNKKELISFIGPPIDVIIENIMPGLTEKQKKCVIDEFRSEYDQNGFINYKTYREIKAVFSSLYCDNKLKIGIVTNKPTLLTQKIVGIEKLGSYIEVIMGIDYPIVNKIGKRFSSKVDTLRYMIDNGLANSDSIYIGDTLGDKDACEAVDIEFIAAKYGFYRWPELELPENSIDTLQDLVGVLKKLR